MRLRNDPRQYDDLLAEWWKPDGVFAVLHGHAASRAALIPPPPRERSVLVDVGCGGGANGPHVNGYIHIGVDIRRANAALSAEHGLLGVQGDATALPLADGCADVVVAGEILEHVPDWRDAVAEACRVLRPGGTFVVDTLADTRLCRFVAVTLGEGVPGGAPRGLHDPSLFVPPQGLLRECAAHGVTLRVWGVRPAAIPLLRWLTRRVLRRGGGASADAAARTSVPIVPTRSTSILYAGKGVKDA
ncbi:MAG: methyltransferase domain-containing protein [Stackebrandtia sp.]